MSAPRFFCDEPAAASGEQRLPERVAHHAVRVLRMGEGDSLVLFDGSGIEVRATLLRRDQSWWIRVEDSAQVSRESPLQAVLAQGLPSADKMDWVVQKAVELGVSAIQPLRAERSVVRLSGERAAKRLLHWQQIAVAACEQSGRNKVPEIRPVLDLESYLAVNPEGAHRVVLEPHAGAGLGTLERPLGSMHILVGPEGGWSPREAIACRAAGCEGVTLGPRVLRTETAGLAALAAMQILWGDF